MEIQIFKLAERIENNFKTFISHFIAISQTERSQVSTGSYYKTSSVGQLDTRTEI